MKEAPLKRPRAIIASRIFAPEGSAAAYRLSGLESSMRVAGLDVTVLTSRPPSGIRSTKGVRRWPVLRDKSGAVRGYFQYASFDIPLFFRLLFARRPSVVVVEPPPTTGVVCRIVCAIKKVPYVYFSADVSFIAAAGIGVNPIVVAILRRVERSVLRGAHLVLTISPAIHDKVVELGVDPSRTIMVGTGIDTKAFNCDEQTVESTSPYLVYAGTMSEVHGAGVFLEAFGKVLHRHPTARLKFFGNGVEVESLRNRAAEIGHDRVDFSPPLPANQIAAWLRGANAGLASLHPNRGYDFAYATKALASLSCGAPVIYAGVGPLRQVISQEALGWVSDWDVDDVANSMDLALQANRSKADRERLSRWVLQHHSQQTVSDRAANAILGSLD